MGGLGVLAGQQGQPGDGVLVDPDQPGGLADAAALGEVLQDRQDLVVRELGVEQRRPLELGEPGLAGVAVEQAVVGLAEVVADREVAGAAPAVVGAVGVLAAEAARSSVGMSRPGPIRVGESVPGRPAYPSVESHSTCYRTPPIKRARYSSFCSRETSIALSVPTLAGAANIGRS